MTLSLVRIKSQQNFSIEDSSSVVPDSCCLKFYKNLQDFAFSYKIDSF